MYLSFDWLPNFQKRIAEVIIDKYNLELIEDPNGPRQGKNFVEKHISDVLNNERKNMNKMSYDNCGITYTITRHGTDLVIGTGNRVKKYFYPWMILGEFVST
jgi:hypothetical protein